MTTGEAQRMMEHKQGRVLTASEEISETLHNTNLALASLNEGWIYFLPHVSRPKRHGIGGNCLFSLLCPEEHLQKDTNGNQIGTFSLEQGLSSNSCSTICEPCNQRVSHINC